MEVTPSTCSSCTLQGDTEGSVVAGERAWGWGWDFKGGEGKARGKEERKKERAWPLFSPSRKKLVGCFEAIEGSMDVLASGTMIEISR